MPYVRDSFWRGREFHSLEQMQQEALRWCREVAGQRACRPLQGAAPASVFAAVEAPALLPLPTRPFVLATWSTAKVGPDIHAKVGKSLYSIPWRLIGQRLDARQTPTTVQFFHQGQLVATDPWKPAGKQTDYGHYPPEKIAFRMRTPTWCRTRADQIGPACVQLVDGLLEVNALFRLRAAQGVLALAQQRGIGAARLEAACAKALGVGDPSYRTVKGILAAHAETQPAPPPTGDGGAAAHLHGPTQLFAAVIPLPTTEAQLELDIATTSAAHRGHGDDEHRHPTADDTFKARP
jgi:Mu transposase, C-terminal domain